MATVNDMVKQFGGDTKQLVHYLILGKTVRELNLGVVHAMSRRVALGYGGERIKSIEGSR